MHKYTFDLLFLFLQMKADALYSLHLFDCALSNHIIQMDLCHFTLVLFIYSLGWC